MNEIDRGLYQSLLTESLVQQLQELDFRLTARQSDLHVEESPDRLAMHLAKVIHTAITSLNKDKRIEVGGELTQKLIQLLVDSTSTNELLKEKLALPPRMLKAIDGKKPDGTVSAVLSKSALRMLLRSLTKNRENPLNQPQCSKTLSVLRVAPQYLPC